MKILARVNLASCHPGRAKGETRTQGTCSYDRSAVKSDHKSRYYGILGSINSSFQSRRHLLTPFSRRIACMRFIVDEQLHPISLRESFDRTIAVLLHTANEIIGYTRHRVCHCADSREYKRNRDDPESWRSTWVPGLARGLARDDNRCPPTPSVIPTGANRRAGTQTFQTLSILVRPTM
jgi:hypothetical protein